MYAYAMKYTIKYIDSIQIRGCIYRLGHLHQVIAEAVESLSLLRKASIFGAYVARLLGELMRSIVKCDGVSSIISGEGKTRPNIVI